MPWLLTKQTIVAALNDNFTIDQFKHKAFPSTKIFLKLRYLIPNNNPHLSPNSFSKCLLIT